MSKNYEWLDEILNDLVASTEDIGADDECTGIAKQAIINEIEGARPEMREANPARSPIDQMNQMAKFQFGSGYNQALDDYAEGLK